MTILLPILTGLQPNSYAHAHGMRTIASLFESEAQNAGHVVKRFPLDWKPSGMKDRTPDAVARVLFAEIQRVKPDRIVCLSHSFGAAFLLFFCQWVYAWHKGETRIDLGIFFDLAINPANFGDDHDRWVPEEVCPRAIAFYQKNGKPMGICGSPLKPRDGVQNCDVSARTINGVRVDHTSLIAHPEVVGWSLAAMCSVYSELFDSSAPAGAPQPPAGKGGGE